MNPSHAPRPSRSGGSGVIYIIRIAPATDVSQDDELIMIQRVFIIVLHVLFPIGLGDCHEWVVSLVVARIPQPGVVQPTPDRALVPPEM